jgi:hypothetical protein
LASCRWRKVQRCQSQSGIQSSPRNTDEEESTWPPPTSNFVIPKMNARFSRSRS